MRDNPSTTQRRRIARREQYNELKNRPCDMCDQRYDDPQQMCLTHRMGEIQRFRLSLHANYAWEEVLIEAAKCHLICRRCLPILARYQWQAMKPSPTLKPGGASWTLAECRAVKFVFGIVIEPDRLSIPHPALSSTA